MDIETPAKSISINADSLDEASLHLENLDDRDILDLVELAEWAIDVPEEEVFVMEPCDPQRPQWDATLVPDGKREQLREALEKRRKIAVRARMTVRGKAGMDLPSHFDFFLWRNEYESGRPVFVRESLVISDVRAKRARGVRSFVLIEAGPLGTLLGDAENPAHTEWQSKGENFKGRYKYGKSYLDFVSNIVSSFVNTLTAEDGKEDPTLLLDIFCLPDDEFAHKDEPRKKKSKNEGETDNGDIDHEPKKKRFRLSRVEGGFTVTKGDAGTHPPAQLDIRIAYDVRRGEPIRKYNTSDFVVGESPIEFKKLHGVKILAKQNNGILAEVLDPDFELTVAGFDTKRDLFVRVRMVEVGDDSKV